MRQSGVAKTEPVAIARARVIRDGKVVETHYSVESIPWHHFRRRLKASKHLKFMQREDQS